METDLLFVKYKTIPKIPVEDSIINNILKKFFTNLYLLLDLLMFFCLSEGSVLI